jgi:hypothetical protein
MLRRWDLDTRAEVRHSNEHIICDLLMLLMLMLVYLERMSPLDARGRDGNVQHELDLLAWP